MPNLQEAEKPRVSIRDIEEYREQVRLRTQELYGREERPTLEEIQELMQFVTGMPELDFTEAYELAKKRNTPEYQAAMARAIRVSYVDFIDGESSFSSTRLHNVVGNVIGGFRRCLPNI